VAILDCLVAIKTMPRDTTKSCEATSMLHMGGTSAAESNATSTGAPQGILPIVEVYVLRC